MMLVTLADIAASNQRTTTTSTHTHARLLDDIGIHRQPSFIQIHIFLFYLREEPAGRKTMSSELPPPPPSQNCSNAINDQWNDNGENEIGSVSKGNRNMIMVETSTIKRKAKIARRMIIPMMGISMVGQMIVKSTMVKSDVS
ncbi:LOW QUALITY PROTEIN: hypothetical protein OSB04_012892 [Centaurea solstitialis]|uniref:Uncharacterized protein n=1 Tax=Centaurea solstitialis TaxID=347529 RepID=A0AA38TWY4_9ASTR|nr:LOW QUALITY PROTEIN: hypothetical protein OSB04_012892 [Centaurea solstitialis]